MTLSEIREFVQMYEEEAGRRIDRILALAGQDDLIGMAGEAHGLIGIAGNVGALAVCERARAMEAACRRGEAETARDLLAPLAASIAASRAALAAWLRVEGARA
jgi:HPt (histidine-containing phosphotransfer) domain-containing protein